MIFILLGFEVFFMEVVVFPHEQQIGAAEDGEYDAHINPMLDRQQDHPEGDDHLHHHIKGRDDQMGHLQFVGHELVGMLAMRLSEMFVQEDAMADGQHGVNAINGEEDDVGEVVFHHHQLAQGKDEDEGDADGTHITRETLGILAEVEETKDEDGHTCNHKKWHVDERPLAIDIKQGQQHRQGIGTRDAVDAVHEIEGVGNAYADNPRDEYHPPQVPVQDAQLMEHNKHSRELHQKPCPTRHGIHIVGKTHEGYQSQSYHEPRIL